MMFAIKRLTEGDPVEIDVAPRGQPQNWKSAGKFSHYDARGFACYFQDGTGELKRIDELGRIRKVE